MDQTPAEKRIWTFLRPPQDTQVNSSQSFNDRETEKELRIFAGNENFVLHAFDKNAGWDVVIVTGKGAHFVQITTAPNHSANLESLALFAKDLAKYRVRSLHINMIRFHFFCTYREKMVRFIGTAARSPTITEFLCDGINNWPRKEEKPGCGYNRRQGSVERNYVLAYWSATPYRRCCRSFWVVRYFEFS